MKLEDLLTSKNKVTCLYNNMNLKACYERIKSSHFMMIPVLEKGSERYLYSLSSYDLLKKIMDENSIDKSLNSPVSSIEIERLIISSRIDSSLEEIATLVANQNYLPIVSPTGEFLGIITRKTLIFYLLNRLEEK